MPPGHPTIDGREVYNLSDFEAAQREIDWRQDPRSDWTGSRIGINPLEMFRSDRRTVHLPCPALSFQRGTTGI